MPTEIYAALLGVFIGGFVSYYFSVKLISKQQGIIASANFRASFSYVISQMAISQNDSSIDIRALLNTTFNDLASAIEIYRPYIPSKERLSYQEAWERYYMPDGKVSFANYYIAIEENGERRDPYALFNQRVNAILSFAKP